MIKSCWDCKAYEPYPPHCVLGYKTTKIIVGFRYDLKPIEKCPKPRTNKEYVELALRK